jgi:hypothetical protein
MVKRTLRLPYKTTIGDSVKSPERHGEVGKIRRRVLENTAPLATKDEGSVPNLRRVT